jgi:hypothetical protein
MEYRQLLTIMTSGSSLSFHLLQTRHSIPCYLGRHLVNDERLQSWRHVMLSHLDVSITSALKSGLRIITFPFPRAFLLCETRTRVPNLTSITLCI